MTSRCIIWDFNDLDIAVAKIDDCARQYGVGVQQGTATLCFDAKRRETRVRAYFNGPQAVLDQMILDAAMGLKVDNF